jgi:hypothetical protein
MEMKKAICLVLVVLVLLFVSTMPGYAVDRGAWHGGSGHHGGGERHGGGSWHGSIWIGPGWGEWGPWWWGPPYYPYYYPYYPETPAVIQQQPPVYVQPEEEYYWYFCQNPQGYYPYVKKCPGGWLKVIPPAPPDEEE